jgi:hypothetical protein
MAGSDPYTIAISPNTKYLVGRQTVFGGKCLPITVFRHDAALLLWLCGHQKHG